MMLLVVRDSFCLFTPRSSNGGFAPPDRHPSIASILSVSTGLNESDQ